MTLEFLFQQHSQLVYNLALQYKQNAEDSEEITQDVFLVVYQKLNTFKEEAAIKTWFYRIIIKKSLVFLKAKKRKQRFSFFGQRNIEEHANSSSLRNFNHPGI